MTGAGAAYGTAKAGIGIAGIGTFRPDLIMKASLATSYLLRLSLIREQCLIPVVMAGIIAVYSLVIAVLLSSDIGPPPNQAYSPYKYISRSSHPNHIVTAISGFLHLAAGLSVGLTGLAAGYAIGIVGDAGVRAYLQQSRVFVGMVLILIFAEVLGLYGYFLSNLCHES